MKIAKRTAKALFVLPFTLVAVPVSATPASAKLAALADCAGAVAAFGHVDPRGGGNDARSPWFKAYSFIFSDMVNIADPEKAQDAVVARWTFWRKQPAAAVSGKAQTCKSQYH